MLEPYKDYGDEYPPGHPLHFAKVYRTPSMHRAIEGACEAVQKLMSQPAVVNSFNKLIDAREKYVNIQPITKHTMKTRNLTLSIFTVIGGFHQRKLNFSAHDVSLALRDAVEKRELFITDVAQDFPSPSGGYVARVEHNVVRQIVRDIFEDSLIPDYAPRNTYRGGVTFVQYQRPDALGEVQRGPSHPVVAAPAVVPVAADALVAAIVTYVERKHGKGDMPTLKRIQSRLKRSPATCDQIRDILKSKGYVISQHFDAPSQDIVLPK